MTVDTEPVRHKGSRPGGLREQMLRQRYLLRGGCGRVVETPNGMFTRVARAVAGVESRRGGVSRARRLARQYACLMAHGIFMPNSPTLMNAGQQGGMCCACFVLPVADSIEGIFDAVKTTALVQKAGGGTGFTFDTLRPTGDLVGSRGGKTSGPISFMRVFSEATMAIQQGAHRRGANMAMLSIEHPDILSFLLAKSDPTAFANFNLSVKVTDNFMYELQQNPDHPHVVTNQRTGRKYGVPRTVMPGRYTLEDLVPIERISGVECYSYGDVWSTLVQGAHATGEPGVCFIDRVNEDNPTPRLGRIAATNPCGEMPLLANEACNLGSINLSRFVMRDTRSFRWDALRRTVGLAVRFLDSVVDLNQYPTPEISSCSRRTRKIGLGVMGFADALMLLGMRYDSQQAVNFASRVSAFIQGHAHKTSCALANELGNFPGWEGSTWCRDRKQPMRNASVTTIAPTGSISIIAGCSSGMEPVFSLACRRRALDGQEFVEMHPLLEEIGTAEGWLTDAVREALLEGVAPEKIEAIPKRISQVLVTAHKVSADWHVLMQAAFQENVDNAVSKTVNLPATATPQEVDRVFRMAFDMKCKGITVYLDGSRSGQTLSAAGTQDPGGQALLDSPRSRPRDTTGRSIKFRTGCGSLFVTVNRDSAGLCEVFANLGKAGGCPSQSEATCRVVSIALRSGVDPKELIEQLRGIRCLSTAMARRKNGVNVLSCPDAIARALEEVAGVKADEGHGVSPVGRACPDCGLSLRREAGCYVCSCGYSRCG